MKMCCYSDCQKREMARRRKLRLEQVRQQSGILAKEIRERVRREKNEVQAAFDRKRAQEIELWKQEQIHVLEMDYLDAMSKIGIAHETAQNEPDPMELFQTCKRRNDVRAAVRGRSAERRVLEEARNQKELKEAPVVRKKIVREVEDIRAGLIVHTGDIAKRTQPEVIAHKTTLSPKKRSAVNQEQIKIQDKHMSPKGNRDIDGSPSKIAKNVLTQCKDSEPTELKKVKSHETPKKSARESIKLPEISISKSSEKTNLPSPKVLFPLAKVDHLDDELVEFYDFQSKYHRVYKAADNLIEKIGDDSTGWSSDNTARTQAREIRQKQRHQLIDQLSDVVHDLQVDVPYQSEPQQVLKPTKKPFISGAKVVPLTTQPKMKSPEKTKPTKKYSKKPRTQNKSTMCERDLMLRIDKALEDGRRLREQFRNNSESTFQTSSSSSDSDEETEKIIKVIVNVKCGADKDLKETKTLLKDAATEIGESFKTSSASENAQMESGLGLDDSTKNDIVFDVSEEELKSIEKPGNKNVSKSSFSTSTSYYSPPSKLHATNDENESSFKFNPALDYYIRRLLKLKPMCMCNNDSSSTNSSTTCLNCSRICEQSITSSTIDTTVILQSSLDNESDKYKEESEKCSQKISEIEKELEQVRREKVLLQISDNASSKPSSSANTCIKDIPNQRLSTILEQDSKLANAPSPSLDVENIIPDLIARKLIDEPFRWSSGESLTIEDPRKTEDIRSDSEELEHMLTRLKMDWAKSCIRRSRDSMVKSSNSDDFDNNQSAD